MFPHISWARFIRPRAHCHHCCRVICEIWPERVDCDDYLAALWHFLIFHSDGLRAMQFWWCHLAIVGECWGGKCIVRCSSPVELCSPFVYSLASDVSLYCMCAENSTNSNLNFSILLSATPRSLLNNVVSLYGICIHPFRSQCRGRCHFYLKLHFHKRPRELLNAWMTSSRFVQLHVHNSKIEPFSHAMQDIERQSIIHIDPSICERKECVQFIGFLCLFS